MAPKKWREKNEKPKQFFFSLFLSFFRPDLKVKTWYDEERLDLVVTVLSAADLPPRVNGQYRNPYAKVFLLPDRRWLTIVYFHLHCVDKVVFTQAISGSDFSWQHNFKMRIVLLKLLNATFSNGQFTRPIKKSNFAVWWDFKVEFWRESNLRHW